MTENRNGFSTFAKGVFAGGVVGAAVALRYALRRRTGLRIEIPQEGVRFERRYRPLPAMRVGNIIETGKRVTPTIGWLVVFCCASAVAMVANLKMKRQ